MKEKYNKNDRYNVILKRVVFMEPFELPKQKIEMTGEFLNQIIEQEGDNVIAEANKV